MSAAAHAHWSPGGKPAVVVAGVLLVIVGLLAITRPGMFRNWPVAGNPRSLGALHTVITRFIGAVFCAGGVALSVLGVIALTS